MPVLEFLWVLFQNVLIQMPVSILGIAAFHYGQVVRDVLSRRWDRKVRKRLDPEEHPRFRLPLMGLGATVQKLIWWQESQEENARRMRWPGNYEELVKGLYQDIQLCELSRIKPDSTTPKLHSIEEATANHEKVKRDMMAIREFAMDQLTREEYVYFMVGKELTVFLCTRHMRPQLQRNQRRASSSIRATENQSRNNVIEGLKELGYEENVTEEALSKMRGEDLDFASWGILLRALSKDDATARDEQ
eukprot:gb/GECG01013192.1/.p1 GENE.gb/GECG01013192.1/~~gb/GECG01013192.1/.p1  ORF type:complete len:247 (+),score=33.71 gb/GECG01013192.1/:1-741(+)